MKMINALHAKVDAVKVNADTSDDYLKKQVDTKTVDVMEQLTVPLAQASQLHSGLGAPRPRPMAKMDVEQTPMNRRCAEESEDVHGRAVWLLLCGGSGGSEMAKAPLHCAAARTVAPGGILFAAAGPTVQPRCPQCRRRLPWSPTRWRADRRSAPSWLTRGTDTSRCAF